MFDIDVGSNGAAGPFIQWSARGTQDGVVPPKSFYLRDGSDKTVLDSFANGGVVMDLDAMKTGWQKSEGIAGVAPEWKWNPTLSQFMPQPGEDYKRGLSVRCAIGGGRAATWEQAGAGAWNAFVALVPSLQQRPGDQLPLVRLVGTKAVQFKRGSTVEPVLEVVKWVPRPDCLKEGAAAGIDTGATQPEPVPAAPAVQPAALAADDMEF